MRVDHATPIDIEARSSDAGVRWLLRETDRLERGESFDRDDPVDQWSRWLFLAMQREYLIEALQHRIERGDLSTPWPPSIWTIEASA